MAPLPFYALLFLLGAAVGTALDQLHMLGGVLSYPAPFLMQQAVWVPPLFGSAAVGFALQHRALRRLFHARPIATREGLLRDGALFFAGYAVSAFAPLSSPLLIALLGGAYAMRAVLVKEPPHRLAHALLCGLAGIAAEATLVSLGAFRHHRAELLGVPYWLPALYLLAAPFIAGLDDWRDRATAS